jgi:5-methylcytosine-specific restriction endonuclease McrA
MRSIWSVLGKPEDSDPLCRWIPYDCFVDGSVFSTKTPTHERIHRSAAARRQFKQENPCPSTGESKGSCPGYVIDHVIPLACGGPDESSNMQCRTVEDAK